MFLALAILGFMQDNALPRTGLGFVPPPPSARSSTPKPAVQTEDDELIPHHVFLRKYDKNGDGKLTEAELPPNLARKLMKADANKDGYLDANELIHARGSLGRKARKAENLKLDEKGQLVERQRTGAALHSVTSELLRRLDTNHDGYVDDREIAAGLQAVQARIGQGLNRGDEGPPLPLAANPGEPPVTEGRDPTLGPIVPTTPPTTERGVRPPPPPLPANGGPPPIDYQPPVATSRPPDRGQYGNPPEGNSGGRMEQGRSQPPANNPPALSPDGLPTADAIIRALDRNGNGYVDRDEAIDKLADNFKMLDKNKDGKLDRAEIERSLKLARMFGIKPKIPDQYRQNGGNGQGGGNAPQR